MRCTDYYRHHMSFQQVSRGGLFCNKPRVMNTIKPQTQDYKSIHTLSSNAQEYPSQNSSGRAEHLDSQNFENEYIYL